MTSLMRSVLVRTAVLGTACGMLGGCTSQPKKPTANYIVLAHRDVPDYLKGTVYEYTDLGGTEPFPVSGYGLVAHLHGTGGSHAPTPVRTFMIKELGRHEFGSLGSGLGSPEQLLASKDVTIVRVDGYLPPGARSGSDWSTWFDIRVTALPESEATSLAHGVLYETDLKVNGANPADPGNGMVTVKAQAAGEVFVNPKYVLDTRTDTPAARRSRRSGVVLSGGRTMTDQPLTLRLRAPERQMARAIERRIVDRFQDVVDDDLRSAAGDDAASSKKIANAEDEAVINIYVPKAYDRNWEHFAGLVKYLYLNGGDTRFAAAQAKILADEALKPDAPLQEISYCLEGLGKPALYAIDPLMSNSKPDIRFAAARAAAFLKDPAAVPILLSIAQTPGDPFRVNAVQVLGELPATPRVDRLCRTLLNSDEAFVRFEAYNALTRHGDGSVYTRWITNGKRERFALDLVPSDALPTVRASRQGVPRIAVFGNELSLELPLMFSCLDGRLTISTDVDGKVVTLFYRGSELPKPVTVLTSARLPEVVAALAGDGTTGGASTLHLGYADVVAVLQALVEQQKIAGTAGEHRMLASFVLQDATDVESPIDARPLVPTGSRPNSDRSKPVVAPTGERPLLRPGLEPAAAAEPSVPPMSPPSDDVSGTKAASARQ